MNVKSFKESFIKFCEKNRYEKNLNQLKIINLLITFKNPKNNFFKFFLNPKRKNVFIFLVALALGRQ